MPAGVGDESIIAGGLPTDTDDAVHPINLPAAAGVTWSI